MSAHTLHEVKYQHGGEVVCTCGAYFRTEPPQLALHFPRTGIALWAEHVRDGVRVKQ